MRREPQNHVVLIGPSVAAKRLYASYFIHPAMPTYRLTEVETGDCGVALCKRESVDCVVLDGDCTDAPVEKLIGLLTRSKISQSAPLLFLRENDSNLCAEAAVAAGALDVLEKENLSAESLRRSVFNLLQLSRLRKKVRYDAPMSFLRQRTIKTTSTSHKGAVSAPPHATGGAILDSYGAIVACDKNLQAILKYDEGELQGRNITTLISHRELASLREMSPSLSRQTPLCGFANASSRKGSQSILAFVLETFSEGSSAQQRFLLTLRPLNPVQPVPMLSPAQYFLRLLQELHPGRRVTQMSWAHLDAELAELRKLMARELGLEGGLEEPIDLAVLIRQTLRNRDENDRLMPCNVSVHIPDPIIGFWNRRQIKSIVGTAIDRIAKDFRGSNLMVRASRRDKLARIVVEVQNREHTSHKGQKERIRPVLQKLSGSPLHPEDIFRDQGRGHVSELTIDLPIRSSREDTASL